MVITQLECINRNKVKVYIDGEYAFLLYEKDIRLFGLAEGQEISPQIYDEILTDTVLRRAKLKALALLKFMDRTEQELRNKLSEAGYKNEIIDLALDYINHYGYINDERYASSYIRTRMNSKSRLMLRMELLKKGIAKDIIDEVLNTEYQIEEEEDPELDVIKKAIFKKCPTPANITWEEKQKLISNLYRKGFEIDKINSVIDKFLT
jgi:regulatory protein